MEDIGEDILWQQLAQELQRQQEEGQVQSASEEEAAAAREITEEEEHVVSTTASALSQVTYFQLLIALIFIRGFRILTLSCECLSKGF